MDGREKIEREVEAALQAFDETERLEADPFFSTRVLARLDRLEKSERSVAILGLMNRVVSPVFIVFMIAVNILTAMVYLNSGGSGDSQTRNQLISSFAEELLLEQDQTILN
jgi:hypothetical protein